METDRGAARADGLDIEQTAELLRTRWPDIRQSLLTGTYLPQPVCRVMIPKPDGSQRELGIPTVLDRVIQQALLQALIDPGFSEHSHGFRSGRRAHDAVKTARAYVQTGKRVVVDVDLAKFLTTTSCRHARSPAVEAAHVHALTLAEHTHCRAAGGEAPHHSRPLRLAQ